MPMFTLYATPTDPTAAAIARTLEMLAVPYVQRDPSADAEAAEQLRALTGALTTPTLVFPDGTVLVRPSPPQLAERLHTVLLPPPRVPVWRALSGLAPAFVLSLAAFALGVALSARIVPPLLSVLVLTAVVLALLGAAVMVLPPLKSRAERLRGHVHWDALRWVLVPAYSALLGLSTTQIAEDAPATLERYALPALGALLALLLAAALTRPLWGRWAEAVTRAQAMLGVVVLLGFVGLLLAGWLGVLTAPPRPLLRAEVGVFGLLLIFGSAQVATSWRSAHPMDGASAVLLPAFGVLMVWLLLGTVAG